MTSRTAPLSLRGCTRDEAIARVLALYDQHTDDALRALTTGAQLFAGDSFDLDFHDDLLDDIRREHAAQRAELVAWIEESPV